MSRSAASTLQHATCTMQHCRTARHAIIAEGPPSDHPTLQVPVPTDVAAVSLCLRVPHPHAFVVRAANDQVRLRSPPTAAINRTGAVRLRFCRAEAVAAGTARAAPSGCADGAALSASASVEADGSGSARIARRRTAEAIGGGRWGRRPDGCLSADVRGVSPVPAQMWRAPAG
jgi:hypothetical protein